MRAQDEAMMMIGGLIGLCIIGIVVGGIGAGVHAFIHRNDPPAPPPQKTYPTQRYEFDGVCCYRPIKNKE
jgi:Translocated intimin receptor (Tir) C-terminus.